MCIPTSEMAHNVLSRHGSQHASPCTRRMRRPLASAPAVLLLCLLLVVGAVLVEPASGRPFMPRDDCRRSKLCRTPSLWNRSRHGCAAATRTSAAQLASSEGSRDSHNSPPGENVDADADAHHAFVLSGSPEGQLLGETKTAKLTTYVRPQASPEAKMIEASVSSVSTFTYRRSAAPLFAFSDLQVV
jgi:hypothetical protein